MSFRYTFLALILILMSISSTAVAQIPNAGFENWTSGEPDGWSTNNSDPFITVTQSSNPHSGSFAAQGTTVDAGFGFVVGPVLTSGEDSDRPGFPMTDRPGSLRGYYKFTSVGGDMFTATIYLQKGDSIIGVGFFGDTNNVSTYQEFVAPIYYYSADAPDTASIVITIAPIIGAHLGSTFEADDLFFGPATGVNEAAPGVPQAYGLAQNFPNPFNPSTEIFYAIPEESDVKLTVYNLLGKEVSVLVNEHQPAGRYKAVFDASKLMSGVYFYTLQAGTFTQTKRMMLVK